MQHWHVWMKYGMAFTITKLPKIGFQMVPPADSQYEVISPLSDSPPL